jgi:hypothetical protein
VPILSYFLAGRYVLDTPISPYASLVSEQSGDSAPLLLVEPSHTNGPNL